MKSSIHFIGLSLFFFYAISCAGKNSTSDIDNSLIDSSHSSKNFQPDSFKTGEVIPNVICNADASQSFSLYLPATYSTKPLPVIYFFDPHGDGALPIGKYKSLADKYNFIFIGSNNSKNGNDLNTSENIWKTLFSDTKSRLLVDVSRVYLIGFSGGAKVATYIALNHSEVKGIVSNGAGSPDIDNATNIPFSFTAIAGRGDLNMTDLISITNGLDKTQSRHRIIFFNGKHEWAPESTMSIALQGFQIDAILQKLIPPDNSFIENFINENKKRIADDISSNKYLNAEEDCNFSLNILKGITDGKWFNDKDVEIKNNKTYQSQQKVAQNLFEKEQNIKNIYQQQFEREDKTYWINTINEVMSKAKAVTPEGAMYQRLQAYLSLAFYSISNQLINADKNTEAQFYVDLYKIVDATNSEVWYFSAILNARNGNASAAQSDLLKAIANGFADKNRLQQQKEFQSQESPINLQEIESKIK